MSLPVSALAAAFLSPRHDLPRLPLRFDLPALDVLLDGGIPRGVIVEIFGGTSSGRTALVQTLVSRTTSEGELVAWVDLSNALDPDQASLAGIRLERLLWIYPSDLLMAFRAAEQVMGAGGFRLVVLDFQTRSGSELIIGPSVWMRLARAAVLHDAILVVLATERIAGTSASLSLEAIRRERAFVGRNGSCPFFEGMVNVVYLRKNKFGPLKTAPVHVFVSTGA